jgi:RNA polymerase-binding protein DksA
MLAGVITGTPPGPTARRSGMSYDLDAKQLDELKALMRDRTSQLREEIRQALLKSDSEQYVQIANEVHELEDESFADLMVDVNLAEIDRDLDELRAIEAALLRVGDGTYGMCEHCGSPIEFRRLQLTPFASRCFDCQSSYERNHVQKMGHTL